jgi:hypothetical protein
MPHPGTKAPIASLSAVDRDALETARTAGFKYANYIETKHGIELSEITVNRTARSNIVWVSITNDWGHL